MDDILSRAAWDGRRLAVLTWLAFATVAGAVVAGAACEPAAPAPASAPVSATAPASAPASAPAAASAPASGPASAPAFASATASAPASAPASAAAPASAPASRPAAAAAPPASASGPPLPPRSRVHLLRRRGPLGGVYDYLVVEPADAGPETPLIVALHGRGSRPERFASVAEELRLPFRTIVVRAPLMFPAIGDLRQWFRGGEDVPAQVDAQVKRLVRFLGALHHAYPKAPKPLIYGFSQGAMLALELVARHPEVVRAAAVLSGSFPTKPAAAGEPARATSASVPVLLTVGAKDVIVKPADTLAAAARLRALGHAPQVFHFAGGHQLPRDVLARLRAFLWRRGHVAAPVAGAGSSGPSRRPPR